MSFKVWQIRLLSILVDYKCFHATATRKHHNNETFSSSFHIEIIMALVIVSEELTAMTSSVYHGSNVARYDIPIS